jgi:hypothetical protein
MRRTARYEWVWLAAWMSACEGADSKVQTNRATPTPLADAGEVGDAGGSGAPSVMVSASLTPTWHQQIAPIVVKRCAACHKPAGVGPFALHTYAAAAPFAKRMAESVEAGRMPPYLASETATCTPLHAYANDLRLTRDEQALLRAWADASAPEGDAQLAAPIEQPKIQGLPREDTVMQLPSPIVVEPNAKADVHTCLVVDPQLASDVYVVGRQITPGNSKILHHVVTYAIKPLRNDAARTPATRAQMLESLRAAKGVGIGERYDCFGGPGLEATGLVSENLGGWAPGGSAALSPYNSGQPLQKDTLVVMDLHYHPLGNREEDRDTKLALMFADARPPFISQPLLLGNFEPRLALPSGIGELVQQPGETSAEFKIPAGAKNHVEEMTWTWLLPNAPAGIRAYYAGTHMHYVGRDMMVELVNTTPAPGESPRECLVQTPRWDFNWQSGYGWQASYEQLPLMNPGDVLRMRCVYDNTLDNPFLARALEQQGLSAPVDVELGEDTLDEMCLGAIGIIYPNNLP